MKYYNTTIKDSTLIVIEPILELKKDSLKVEAGFI